MTQVKSAVGMEKKIRLIRQFSSFKIVLIYAIVSAVYIFTSDYFLQVFIPDIDLISRLQTVKGLSFILITAMLLHLLMKRNIDKISDYYQQILGVKQQSEELTEQSKQEYIKLFNHSPLPMWIIDKETLEYLHVNEMACTHYGFLREDYLSMTIKDSNPMEEIPHIETVLNKTLMNVKPPYSAIMKHRKKNGEIIQVKIKTSEVTFEGKKGMLVSAVDITAEIEIQNKLIENNLRLQLASEMANLGYWTNDLIKSKIIWTDEIYKIFEIDKETFELTSENIEPYFHPEDRLYFDNEIFNNFDENNIIENELRITTESGKLKWLLVRIHMIKDNNGKPIQLEGIILDITKRKMHEQEIWESNERFKRLTKATVEAIIDRDTVNNEIFFGDGFRTMFGYNILNPSKSLWKKNLHPEDKIRVIRGLNKAVKNPNQEHFDTEYRFIKANGDIAYIQHKGIFIRNVEGQVIRIIGAMVDLTESLEKMNKIELQDKALKDISWTQSHVVRAPLANLLGLISLLKDNKKAGVTDDKLIDFIDESAQKIDSIIHDIVKKTKNSDT